MQSALAREKARWAIAAAIAGAVITLVMVLFRRSTVVVASPSRVANAAPALPPAKQVVQLAKSATADRVLAEELVLRDMRPLFLPTEGLTVSPPEPRREPGKTFLDNETLKLTFSETDLDLDRGLPPVATVNGKPAQSAKALDVVVGEGAAPAMTGFGREPAKVSSPPVNGGVLEVVAVATGHRVWGEPLPADARAPGSKPWKPVEFLASIDAAGLSVPLAVTSSSEVEEVDAHYRNYLARRYRIGDRLPPGFYRVTVGP